ncbi:aminotransferase class I/II-fold pyridoxal phosphate-dependent enzyme [Bacillus halotolerans]|uniref:Aminotransferase class I/II-fold pyridoxal phosphate-dependent enzyme n=1 Tax=Bacillus halotolerans TaxID=260554 RepID=A0ABY7I2P4_9BACI|nr:aminotransferase class I/II-fold pyridoxal phosphate-dependent enzyme [Bacillus halotolerans]MBV5121389.1 aminotransferase class I/II-fold pyridoxal phosphate-dependent enzyme [Bacillus halotolerans]MCC2117871.1 aminotransferase class I/II-fold pyridoxal phosphate-dependent enzyme [Bacillus halotolerans]UUI84451.1 aminotransferase class I/II-fold pyridoxal phosphate-dependent enzyme [Bacillus halotolerans]WAT21495.1 aminotransferase class I/II-fold pyridoxal phosphate-dependent enzyme [Bacil
MNTPLYHALIQHARRNSHSFHVPGHHNGDVFFDEAKTIYNPLLTIDLTELSGLDDLHHPSGVIKEAQDLVSQLYGSAESFFLVNGTTVGNLAMILSVCDPGDTILIQRNCHKSVFHAVDLAEAEPIYLAPDIDEIMHVPTHVPLGTIKEALKAYPNAKGLVLTNPTYYGHSADLTEIISEAHQYGIPVLVDEAHGAHFVLGEPFPASALQMGADIVVQSAHKTLPAMTMGSYLHLNSNKIERNRVADYLNRLQSSSPSYPIMASLDLARAYLQHMIEEQKLPDVLQHIQSIKQTFDSLGYAEAVEPANQRITTDPLKLTIRSKCGHSGFTLQKILERVNIFTELADENQVLLVLPLGGKQRIDSETIKKIDQEIEKTPSDEMNVSPEWEAQPITVMPYPKKVLNTLQKEYVGFDKAAGRLNAEDVIPYPPGIPMIMAGERITRESVQKLSRLISMKTHVQGNMKINEKQLLVYIEEEKS